MITCEHGRITRRSPSRVPVRPRSRRHRALRRRVEPAHRLDDVAVQQEPRRERMGRAVDVDDPPAHREIPGVGRRGKAGVAEGDETRRRTRRRRACPPGIPRRPRRRRPREGASSPPRRRSGRRPRRGGRKGAGAARASGRGPRGGAGGPARTASPRWKGTGGPRRGQDRRSVPGSPPPPLSRRRTGKGACGRGARRDGPRGTTAPRAGSASTGRKGGPPLREGEGDVLEGEPGERVGHSANGGPVGPCGFTRRRGERRASRRGPPSHVPAPPSGTVMTGERETSASRTSSSVVSFMFGHRRARDAMWNRFPGFSFRSR